MQVLLDIVRARARPSLVVLQDLLVDARILESEIHGAARELPDFSPQSIRKADLDKAVEGGVADKSEVAPVLCGQASNLGVVH